MKGVEVYPSRKISFIANTINRKKKKRKNRVEKNVWMLVKPAWAGKKKCEKFVITKNWRRSLWASWWLRSKWNGVKLMNEIRELKKKEKKIRKHEYILLFKFIFHSSYIFHVHFTFFLTFLCLILYFKLNKIKFKMEFNFSYSTVIQFLYKVMLITHL